jgi:hypothetical protein
MYPNTPAPAPPAPEARDPALDALYPSMRPAEPPAAPAPAQDQAPPPVAEYADLALPEGFALDQAAFAPVAQKMAEARFSKPQAEAAIALYAERQAEDAKAFAAERQSWRAEAERGFTPETRQAISTAMQDAPAEVHEILNASGLGDHPALVRWIADLGRRLGGIGKPAGNPHAALYPSMKGRR